jgi:hypothetical protein
MLRRTFHFSNPFLTQDEADDDDCNRERLTGRMMYTLNVWFHVSQEDAIICLIITEKEIES